jgi:hypothetical protein
MPYAPRDDIIDQPGVFPPTSLAPPAVATPIGSDGSPTTLIHQYLAARGLQPTAANVSAALLANAQRPGTIAGLENQAPPSSDSGGSASSGSGGSQALPVPPTPPSGPPAPTGEQRDKDNTPVTTPPMQPTGAQPAASSGNGNSDLAMSILFGVPIAGGAAYALNKLRGGDSGSAAPPTQTEAAKPAEPDKPAEPAEVVKASEESAAPKPGPRRSPLYPDNPNIVYAPAPPVDQMLPSEGGTPIGRPEVPEPPIRVITPKPAGSPVLRKFSHGRG